MKNYYIFLSGMRKDLTLVETVIVFSLLTIIVGITYGVLRANQITDQTAHVTLSLYQEAKRISDEITEKLSASSFNHISIQDTNPDEIIFQIPIDVATFTGKPTWGAFWEGAIFSGDYFRYYVENNYLKKEIVDNTLSRVCGPKVIAQYVKDLQIEHPLNTNYLKINITLEKNILFSNRKIEHKTEIKIYPQNQ